jgi:hypothetical protein
MAQRESRALAVMIIPIHAHALEPLRRNAALVHRFYAVGRDADTVMPGLVGIGTVEGILDGRE